MLINFSKEYSKNLTKTFIFFSFRFKILTKFEKLYN